jgi:CheY-like chemotaxis protein
MTQTILIVEDDAELHEIYLAMLETVECRIIQAYDGLEALEKLADTIPDLILLDIVLDEMMGDEFLVEIRQKSEYADIPVVIVSALPIERCQHLLDRDAKSVFLRKPFRRGQLLEAVQEGLACGQPA